MTGGNPPKRQNAQDSPEVRCVVRDGEVWVKETAPGLFAVSWYPHRQDHPDYPGFTIDSSREQMPVEGGLDAVADWACKRFEGRDPRELLEVTLDAGADEEEVAAVTRVFDEAGVPAIVTANYHRRSVGELPWVLILAAPLTAFLTRLATNAADDAHKALKSWIARLYEARRDRDGSIRIDDEGRTFILTRKIPDEGIRELAEGKLDATGYYVWDAEHGAWRKH
jgi:hypothetical protein